MEVANGKPRPDALALMLNSRSPASSRARLTYDAARDSTEFAKHWANADALDADAANSFAVRQGLRNRSRYEAGSNAFYAGIMRTHVNLLVGCGPKLRMLSDNRNFNNAIEESFFDWAEQVGLAAKLRTMAHAKIQDGEAFALLQRNPAIEHDVQLDLMLIEAEQVQTPYLPFDDPNYVDGIKLDGLGNVLWYDVLPQHPGSAVYTRLLDPVKVPARSMLHWFTAERPGQHRGIPAMTSSLNVGAAARRMREAVLAAAETAADLNVVATTQLTPDTTTDPMAPFSTIPIQKRMLTIAPSGWDLSHMKSEHPNSTYEGFMRSHIMEGARPISQPINAAMCDSSTYSFASGKLDTLCYRAELNSERDECNAKALDHIFREWYAEYALIRRRRFTPLKQWDWPAHPVIDVEAEARATDTDLKNGMTTFRDAYSARGEDYDDKLQTMARDWFGEVDESTIGKARQIQLLRNVSKESLPYVAAVIGVTLPQPASEGAAA